MSSATDIFCPVCGYYCVGKGGVGCIDKLEQVLFEGEAVSRDDDPDWGDYGYYWDEDEDDDDISVLGAVVGIIAGTAAAAGIIWLAVQWGFPS